MPKESVVTATIVFAFLLSVSAVVAVDVANAFVLPSVVEVTSPLTNQTNPKDVMLSFTVSPHEAYKYTSFSCCLDGQTYQPTDGNTLLSDLEGGKHTLSIYGNGSYASGNQTYTQKNALLGIVNFVCMDVYPQLAQSTPTPFDQFGVADQSRIAEILVAIIVIAVVALIMIVVLKHPAFRKDSLRHSSGFFRGCLFAKFWRFHNTGRKPRCLWLQAKIGIPDKETSAS